MPLVSARESGIGQTEFFRESGNRCGVGQGKSNAVSGSGLERHAIEGDSPVCETVEDYSLFQE